MVNSDTYEMSETHIIDNLFGLKLLVRSYQLWLEGYTWDERGDKKKRLRHQIAGQDFIEKSTAILDSYAEKVNLLSDKDKIDLAYQEYDDAMCVNAMMLKDPSIRDSDYEVIITKFCDVLRNMIDIIKSSRNVAENYIVSKEEMGGGKKSGNDW
jgi:hypothetical protein